MKTLSIQRISAVVLLLVMLMIVGLTAVAPAHAAGTITITGGSSGVTIQPGTAPNMTIVGSGDITTAGQKVIDKGQAVAKAITGICTIICFVAFMISVTKLATSGSSPIIRRAALTGILWSGVAIALFGGSWIVVSFFWNFLT